MWRNRSPHARLVGMQNGPAAVRNSTGVLETSNTELPQQVHFLGRDPRESGPGADLGAPAVTAAAFTVAQELKQPKHCT